jgi:hypothetical protein
MKDYDLSVNFETMEVTRTPAKEDMDLVAETWNSAYPERRPWDQIGAEAQLEWRRVFAIYESLKA